jgi:hypothetical protein
MVNICNTKFVIEATSQHYSLWANGESSYSLANSDYNYYTSGVSPVVDNPATANLPVKDTESLTKFSQIFPATGVRNTSGSIATQGTSGDYYSSTPYNSIQRYIIDFNSATTTPNFTSSGYGHHSSGISIRCVRI